MNQNNQITKSTEAKLHLLNDNAKHYKKNIGNLLTIYLEETSASSQNIRLSVVVYYG